MVIFDSKILTLILIETKKWRSVFDCHLVSSDHVTCYV